MTIEDLLVLYTNAGPEPQPETVAKENSFYLNGHPAAEGLLGKGDGGEGQTEKGIDVIPANISLRN